MDINSGRLSTVSAREGVLTADSTRRTGPVRTCIGCRRRDLRANVLRVVADSRNGVAYVRFDARVTMSGRGAWLHEHCLEKALTRRAFARALRLTGPVDTSEIEELARQARTTLSSIVDMESGLEADGHPMSTQR
ncbi:hypothetical protein SAMN06309944_1895 [Micrococcales bacterium KH10]|nr:hypothetical protein SAMN06309944_1895 [Micrococcales bacterium KH10]